MNTLRRNKTRERIQFNPSKDHKNKTKREKEKTLGG